MATKYKSTPITKEQTKAYGYLSNSFIDRLREVFKGDKFTKLDIIQTREHFEDLEKQYKDIFKTKWSFFDYEERLSKLIAQTGIKSNNFKMDRGTYWFE
jgi:hypothetical protein